MMETITSYEGKVLGFAFGAIGEASSGVYAHACACAQAISERAKQGGDIDAATEDGAKGKALTAIVRDWGVTNTKQRAQCLITLASKTIPNVGAKYYRASKDDYEELCKRTDAATRANRLDHAARLRPAGALGHARNRNLSNFGRSCRSTGPNGGVATYDNYIPPRDVPGSLPGGLPPMLNSLP